MGNFLSVWVLGNSLDSAAVLITASLGAFLAFRMKLFNFGGEGQIYSGGAASSALILFFQNNISASSFIVLPLAFFAAIAAGALLGGTCGFLKKKWNADELLTSFLLSAAIIPVIDSLVLGVLRDTSGNLLASKKFKEAFLLPKILPPSNLSVSFLFAILLAVFVFLFLTRTAAGYRYSITGASSLFASYGGICKSAFLVPSFAISGAFHGLAGFFFCAGSAARLYGGFSGGTGWNAVAIALLARNNPLIIIPASIIFCFTLSLSNSALLLGGLNLETKSFIEAAVIWAAAIINSKRGENV